MIMTAAAAALEALIGPLFRWVTVPALILGAVVMGHMLWEKRDARLLREGEQICDARWRAEVREQEAATAGKRASAAEEILETERRVAEELRNELTTIQAEAVQLRATAAGGDPDCPAGGVLNPVGDVQPKRSQPKPAPKGTGRRRKAEPPAASSLDFKMPSVLPKSWTDGK